MGNHISNNDLLDNVHPEWELDCQKNYVFYKVEDASKRIRGVWVHDDGERQKVEASLERTLGDIRNGNAEPDLPPQHAAKAAPGNAQAGDGVVVTMSSLRSALHALADDEQFLRMVMQKLKEKQ